MRKDLEVGPVGGNEAMKVAPTMGSISLQKEEN